jgi:hypothetical protein
MTVPPRAGDARHDDEEGVGGLLLDEAHADAVALRPARREGGRAAGS